MYIISECWNGRQCKLKFCWLVAVNVQVVPRILKNFFFNNNEINSYIYVYIGDIV